MSADGAYQGRSAAAASRATGGSVSTSSAGAAAVAQLTARHLYTEEGAQEYKGMQAGEGQGQGDDDGEED